MKEFLSENDINYTFVDITESMMNLKRYLKYRDNRPEFEKFKKIGRVGIPFLDINDGEELIFDEKPNLSYLKE